MQHSPSWEANWFAASQGIFRILWNPKVHNAFTSARHLSLSWASSFQSLSPTYHFLKFYLNTVFPSTPVSPQWSLSPRFPHQNPVHDSPIPIRATCPAHLILLDFITPTILGEDYRTLSSSLCSFLHSPVTSSLLGPNITSKPYSQTHWAYVSPSISATTFHTHISGIITSIFYFSLLDRNVGKDLSL